MAITILRTLGPPDGVAVRGSLCELGGRLYWLAGECGPNGAPGCNSTASWQTLAHTRQCPGALCSMRLDGTDFRVDHAFSALEEHGENQDGYHPYGTLAASRGRLYGVAQMGGVSGGAWGDPPAGYGTLFEHDPSTGALATLHHFGAEPRAADGMYPMGAVVVDDHGSVFGQCKGGGAGGVGSVWQWSPSGAFRFAPLPGEGYGGLAHDGRRLHGTTWSGGDGQAGVYFTVDPETLEVTVEGSFPAFAMNDHGTDNTPIQAPLVLSDSSVLVAREFGGPHGTGLIARLTPGRGVTPLWSPDDISLDAAPRFSNRTGGMLNGNLCEGRDGMVYGCAQYGGAGGAGGIYRIARDGSMQELIHSFDADAGYPYGGPILASDGSLRGTTFAGLVWRLDLPT
jgi:uncharacterized repeat protein (TIGR03803 family)